MLSRGRGGRLPASREAAVRVRLLHLLLLVTGTTLRHATRPVVAW